MEYYKNLDLEDIAYFCDVDNKWKFEQWRDVVGYEGLYQASILGRIKTLNYNKTRKHGILRQTLSNSGYLTLSLYRKPSKNTRSVHIIVAKAFIPNPENKPCVNHKSESGDKTNNTVTNLEWVTHSENNIHAYHNSLSIAAKGESYKSKLTEKQVIEIRNTYNNQAYKEIASIYLVSAGTIGDIVNRRSWKHI